MESESSKNIRLVSSSAETKPLLSPVSMPTLQERIARVNIMPRHLCLPSKAAVLILFWSGIVGATFTLAMDATVAVGVALNVNKNSQWQVHNVVMSVLIPYVCLAFAMLLYPLSGFMADVCCGRYRSVMISLCVLASSLICFTIGCSILALNEAKAVHVDSHSTGYRVGKDLLIIIVIVAFVLFFIGLSGFQANFIQLGLDQLLEAPSEYLGLFVHWALGAGHVAAPVFHILFAVYGCMQSKPLMYVLFSLPLLCLIGLVFILIFSCWKRHWFYTEPGQRNPYKTVMKVLIFAKNHTYPLRRSAFTFDDRFVPTRIDFAKDMFGGPFTTEQVEDVKTFLRIMVVLLVLGPIYALEVPTSYFLFPTFSLHTGQGPRFDGNCSTRWLLVESGTLGYAFSVVAFPVYMWFIFVFLRKCIPRMFCRLFLGGFLLFSTVVFMLVSDLVGHLHFDDSGLNFGHQNESGTYCMFKLNISSSEAKALNLSWGVQLVPGILISISPMLITTTALEFISAQSPHSMKGLLVGMMFAIKGLFQLTSAILVLPFSIPNYWSTLNPRHLNCGFSYLLIVSGLALFGLVVLSIVAKRYRYRERDDPPYDQTVVEDVFVRNINHSSQGYRPRSQTLESTDSFFGSQ